MEQAPKSDKLLYLHFDVDHNEFLVHLENDHWLDGTVYPIERYEELSTGLKGWSYLDGNNNGTDDLSEAQAKLSFKYCWRGVWEGRLYFNDEEYWSEDLPILNALWIQIEPKLKEIIKAKDPDNTYDD